VIGSPIAGVLVCLVALSVSLHVCLATIGFFWVYRLVEGSSDHRSCGQGTRPGDRRGGSAGENSDAARGQSSPAVDNQVKLRLLRDPPNDNRDVGLSTHLHDAQPPNLDAAMAGDFSSRLTGSTTWPTMQSACSTRSGSKSGPH
jgi:hypothetical protein